MTSAAGIEERIVALGRSADAVGSVRELLEICEGVLERWIVARGEVPTRQQREGFRLLALHRQGARGIPSFNACRESCREMVYHYNLIAADPGHPMTSQRLAMAAMVAAHLFLFVTGKMEVEQLGEFCCSSRPLRADSA